MAIVELENKAVDLLAAGLTFYKLSRAQFQIGAPVEMVGFTGNEKGIASETKVLSKGRMSGPVSPYGTYWLARMNAWSRGSSVFDKSTGSISGMIYFPAQIQFIW